MRTIRFGLTGLLFIACASVGCLNTVAHTTPIDPTGQTDKSTVVPGGTVDHNAWDALCKQLGQAANCDLCASYGWYGDGVCDTFCPSPDPDCGGTSTGESPYHGTAAAIPGTIEAEDYDLGGEGVAYHDSDATNTLAQWNPSVDRGDGVDLKTCTDTTGCGAAVGSFAAGEWLNYTVDVAAADTYAFSARVATIAAVAFHLELDGAVVSGAIAVPVNESSWDGGWETVNASGIDLPVGTHILRIVNDGGYFDLNDFTVAPQGSCSANCDGKMCGSDGCGGSCGTCSAGQTCDTSGQCGAIPPGGTNALLGIYDGYDNPPFHTWMGRYPDFAAGNAAVGPGAEGSNPCTANGAYPMQFSFGHLNDDFPDGAAAARGDYNSAYQTTIDNLIGPCADHIYYARIDWEWNGNWFPWSPWYNESDPVDETHPLVGRDPATWVAGVRQLISVLKADPRTAHIKIYFDVPLNAIEEAYYPGDDVVDLIGQDVYFYPSVYGQNSSDSWIGVLTGHNSSGVLYDGRPNLNLLDTFATAHDKAIAFGEWGDLYCDGNNITQMAAWIATHNVVAHDYWDEDLGTPANLQGCSGRQQAYIDAFGSTHYTGSYWTTVYPIATDSTWY